jgi:DNA repair protein RadC
VGELEIEHLRVLHVGADLTVVGTTEASGTRDRVDMPLRRIVADALRWNATALVLSHNHPSGDPRPSRHDILATSQLSRIVNPLGIRVHDHIVTAGDARFSFRAAGLL